MTAPNRILRRQLETALRDLPTPPPPIGLLAAIRADIPARLLSANDDHAQSAKRVRLAPGLRVAAAVAIASVGLVLTLRTLARQPTTEPRAPIVAETTPVPLESLDSRHLVSDTPKEKKDPLKEKTAGPVPREPATVATGPAAESHDSSSRLDADAFSSLGAVGQEGERGAIAAEAPLRDQRRISANAPADKRDLERSPTARDPWMNLQATPGPPADRVRLGGQEEPAAGDMFFRATETNPFVDTAEDRLSTFSLDVDTGSWTLARSYLERGSLPPAAAVRVEEFVNAQSYDDPAPRRGDFTLVAEGAPSPFAPGEQYRLLRFAVQAREIEAGERQPANLTFVVDVSGSMDRDNRLGLVQRALGLLLDELRPSDRVALVVYGSRGRVVLRHGRDREAIRDAIAGLRPEGSTNAEEGLRLGYDLAGEAWQSGWINRVVLCSDGVANVGASGPESILARIGSEARRGIELTTVGFGMGNYNDALMEQLADQGDGSYHYVDSLAEARRIFVDELTGTLETVAQEAKVQVEFDARLVDRWRLVGYENRDIADRDFRNDSVDAGEIGAGQSAVALYEVRLRERTGSERRSGKAPLATLRLRWKSRATRQVEEERLILEQRDLAPSFGRASGNLRTAAVAAELAERLRGSHWATEGTWRELDREADRLLEERPRTHGELALLVHRAAALVSGSSAAESEREERE